MIPVTNLRPFTRMLMTIGQIPTSYLISMSYEEQLLWFCNYLEKTVIPAIDNNAEAVEELQDLFVELKSYVDNYFDNLDVQEEINNKLDEMAEQGQLADIIAQYLGLAGVLAFDTISDMSSATNIDEGSICRTLGQTTYNDGKGAFYKVRTITSGDVIDGVNIVALSASNTLIAERMPDYYINEINQRLDNMTNKKVIIIGDSYANRTNSWADRIKTYSGLGNNCVIKAVSGVGFYNTINDVNFSTMVVDNIPFTGSEVTDIIVCGGYNDQGASGANLESAINNFVTICKTNYPNAKIYVGFIGWCIPGIANYGTIVGNLASTKRQYIDYCSKYDNVHYLNNVEYSLHLASNIDDSYFHPNDDGQLQLSINIMRAWLTGSCNYNTPQLNITSTFTPESHVTSITSGALYSVMENNISRLFTNNDFNLKFDETTSFTFPNDIKLGTFTGGYLFGRGRYIVTGVANVLINTKNNGYFTVPGTIYLDEGSMYLRAKVLNRTGTAWVTDSLKYIQISGLNITADSMLQY